MFLQLNHQRLEIYKWSKQLVVECYRVTESLPKEEKYGLVSQIRRAAVSVHLNTAEGSSRKSETERRRFFEISRSSLIEIDAAFDIAFELEYLKNIELTKLKIQIISCFKLLTGLIRIT
jgi:four helix bundle protein